VLMLLFLFLLLLLVTPVPSDIVTFASATNIAMAKTTTTTDTFCFTGRPQELHFKLEDSFMLKPLLSNPEDKSVAKDVTQEIKKFYLRDRSNSAAFFSSATDVRNDFLLCSHSKIFSMSIQLGSVMVRKTVISGT